MFNFPRRTIAQLALTPLLFGALITAGQLGVSGVKTEGLAQTPPTPQPPSAPLVLRSTPENVIWGYIAAGISPALRINSGQIVQIDTLSHQGILTENPVTFFGRHGIPADKVLPDLIAVFQKVVRPKGASVHVLTGPIYIDGAQPGDTLEVRILEVKPRVPYGVNSTGPGRGVLPNLFTKPVLKVIQLDLARNVALFSKNIEVPLQPFMGIMAVAPSRDMGMVSSGPPGLFGGNLDFKDLTKGATLYLPVFNPGAQFFTGDGHSVQGDGEVDGGALETSLTCTLQFILHKGKRLEVPRAETKSHYVVMGLDLDLDEALKKAVSETVKFLGEVKGLSPADAYALASIAVDYKIAEAVDQVQLVVGMIPKNIFKEKTDYWYKE